MSNLDAQDDVPRPRRQGGLRACPSPEHADPRARGLRGILANVRISARVRPRRDARERIVATTDDHAALQLFIDGACASGEGRDTGPVLNPATGETIAEVPFAMGRQRG